MTDSTKNEQKRLSFKGIKSGLPSLEVRANQFLDSFAGGKGGRKEKIPNASLIYGVASAVLFSIALYYFFTQSWFTGLLVLVIAAALFGYALVYLRSTQ